MTVVDTIISDIRADRSHREMGRVISIKESALRAILDRRLLPNPNDCWLCDHRHRFGLALPCIERTSDGEDCQCRGPLNRTVYVLPCRCGAESDTIIGEVPMCAEEIATSAQRPATYRRIPHCGDRRGDDHQGETAMMTAERCESVASLVDDPSCRSLLGLRSEIATALRELAEIRRREEGSVPSRPATAEEKYHAQWSARTGSLWLDIAIPPDARAWETEEEIRVEASVLVRSKR